MTLYRHGLELRDDKGRRVAWLGFGKMSGCSMRLSWEEHEAVKAWIDHALNADNQVKVSNA